MLEIKLETEWTYLQYLKKKHVMFPKCKSGTQICAGLVLGERLSLWTGLEDGDGLSLWLRLWLGLWLILWPYIFLTTGERGSLSKAQNHSLSLKKNHTVTPSKAFFFKAGDAGLGLENRGLLDSDTSRGGGGQAGGWPGLEAGLETLTVWRKNLQKFPWSSDRGDGTPWYTSLRGGLGWKNWLGGSPPPPIWGVYGR